MAKQRKSLSARVKKDTSPSVEAQEKALRQLQKNDVPAVEVKDQTRVSVDFPNELYEIMKKETRKKGQTLRGFIVSLVAAHYNHEDI